MTQSTLQAGMTQHFTAGIPWNNPFDLIRTGLPTFGGQNTWALHFGMLLPHPSMLYLAIYSVLTYFRSYLMGVGTAPKLSLKTKHYQPSLQQLANVWLKTAFWVLFLANALQI